MRDRRGTRRPEGRSRYSVLSTQYPVLSALLIASLLWVALGSFLSARESDSSSLRRPVALVLADNGKWLFTANRGNGTVSVIDPAKGKVVAEIPVGRKLADLATIADGKQLVAVDEAAGDLIVLNRHESKLEIAHRVKVSAAPVSVRVAADGSHCTVAALWSHRLDLVALGATPRLLKSIDLPFAPRAQLPVTDKKLVVAAAFGGRLAVVDLDRGEVESVRALPAHNIRGLALSSDGKRLLVAHQILHALGSATFDDIHWGNLITNNLRVLDLAKVLDPKGDLLAGSDLLYLGEVGHGTADPAAVVVAGGQMLVPLAGVGELAFGESHGWRYVAVGAGPSAVVAEPNGGMVYVANAYADSVSVVDLKEAAAVKEIALGPRRELTAAERGEALFHDGRLAHDGWMSCQSCHTDGHSSGKLADTLGDGTYGTPKRVLSLLGVGDTGPWAWNGSMTTLDAQVRKSIETTMHGKKPTDEQVRDLTAYLQTLPPPPSRDRLRDRINEEAVKRGRSVFAKHSCGNCHAPPTYTSGKPYDVGLTDEAGMKHFNPPSLRGISQGGPYLHDGRAATLEQVFTKQRHQIKVELARQDLQDLLGFLATL